MESSLVEINGFYMFPLYQTAKLKWSYHFLFCFLIIIFLGFILIPGKDQVKIILNVFFLLFAVLFGYAWLAVGFFKKPYLNINDEYLEYKWLFGHKVIPLSSIYQVEFFSERELLILECGLMIRVKNRSGKIRTDFSAGIIQFVL